MSGNGPRGQWGLWLLAIIVGACVATGIVWRFLPGHSTPDAAANSFPLPPYSDCQFLNVSQDAKYIGSPACAACHKKNQQSYALTPHSRALAEADPATVPSEVTVRNALLGRNYRLYHQDGKLRQEETVQADSVKVMARLDLAVKYVIGSGHFSQSFLTEAEGFLYESPVTWYATTKKWDITPGHNTPSSHWGSERPIKLNCLVCHTGRVEETDGAVHRLTIHEQAIGCENCHGPGSLHADRYRGQAPTAGEDDWTIVHPAKLSRQRLDSLCAECHQSSAVSVYVRGRKPRDFRPGRPLTDYRVFYQFAGGTDRMTVVGHVDQLRQSPCYEKSDSLTCVTCHDPHMAKPLTDKTGYYRQKCLTCHTSAGCKLGQEERVKKEKDNCIACHMPRGDTEIPHIAFTHHRIGRHTTASSQMSGLDPTAVPDLVAIDENPILSPLDRERNLGLAYVEAFRKPANAQVLMVLWERAKTHLEAVYQAGLRDGEMLVALAEIHWRGRDLQTAAAYAREALAANDTSSDARVMALSILAEHDRSRLDFAAAATHIEDAIRIRRSADLWRLLGKNYLDNNQIDRAIPAFETALSIRPFRPSTYDSLAKIYRQLGDMGRANDYQRLAKWLEEHGQD